MHWKDTEEQDYNINQLEGCELGRRITCSLDLDLSEFNGKDIEFFFKIYDALQSVESNINTITIDNDDPLVTINNPVQDSNEGSRRVLLDITIDETVDMLEYKDLSDNNPKFRRLCKNCLKYNKTKSFKDGQHNLIIKATDYVGNQDEKTVDFFVDSKAPKIKKILPKKNSIVSGTEFSVEYDEDNLQSVELTIESQTQGTTTIPLEGCEAGRKKICTIEYPSTQYDGEDIEFYFTVADVATETQSKTHTITVDSTPPEITINLPEDGSVFEDRRVQFDIAITEEVTLEYKDTADSNPKFKRLCKKCDEYIKSKSFRRGEEHNLEIKATDKAGNTDTEFVSFTIL